MGNGRKIRPVVPGDHRGWLILPSEGSEIYLNPAERTLYRLFLDHPEGLASDDLVLHWQELCDIYARESCFDDPTLRENALVSLCSESKRVFYAIRAGYRRPQGRRILHQKGPERSLPDVCNAFDSMIYGVHHL